jgi:hypothetical protein
MVLQHLNWLAVAVSAIAYFCLGAVWFGPIFGKLWMKQHGLNPPTDEEKKQMNVPRMMTMSFIKTFIMVILVAYVTMIINYNGDIKTALKIGAVLGGISAFPIGINYIFMKKSITAWILDGGYHACGVIISSLILSAWR